MSEISPDVETSIHGVSNRKETRSIASLRKRRLKHTSAMQRGEEGVPRSIQLYLHIWLYAMLASEYKAYGLKLIAYSLLSVSMLFSLEAHAQSQALSKVEVSGAATLQQDPKLLHPGDTLPSALWDLPIVLVDALGRQDTVPLSTFRGKDVLVLDFWASWCAPCIRSVEKWAELATKYPAHIELLPVHMDFDAKAAPFLKKRGWQLRTAISARAKNLNSCFFTTRAVGGVVWIFRDGTFLVPDKATKALNREDTVQILRNRGLLGEPREKGDGHG